MLKSFDYRPNNMKKNKPNYADISVVIPSYKRYKKVVDTIKIIKSCDPLPGEILVHIDGGDHKSAEKINDQHSDVKLLISEANRGPGGGRNLLIEAAHYEIVASFDDDSYPVDKGYFARLEETFSAFPEASVVASNVFTQNQVPKPKCSKKACWVHSFTGCGCAYRRSHFLKIDGYLELPLAYGAEEQDVALQLYCRDRRILKTNWLRVYHDTAYAHRQNVETRAAWIANTALLVVLRYPPSMIGRGLLQVGNAMYFAFKQGRSVAIARALMQIPLKLAKFWHRRTPLPPDKVRSYLTSRSSDRKACWPSNSTSGQT